MKLRLPLLLRLALLSTAAAYTLGSGCLFADDAPTDAAQDDPIAEAVDEEEGDSPAIGFEGYTESQLVDIQSSDSAGTVIRQMLENSTTGAVANVGTTSSTSNGATAAAAESPALTLSAPAEPATDTTLTTSTLSDSAGEGAVAPFFSAEEAAALVVSSPATSTPSVKNASTATLSSSDSPDETTSSSSATGASSSLGSVGTASAGGAGASSGGASASYSLTSSAPDSSSSSLVITTPTDDTSSDPIAEDILEDSTTEDTTTSTTLQDSSASTLATTSSTTPRSLPPLKLLGAAGDTGDLTWTNASGDGIWNTSSLNWTTDGGSTATTFSAGNSVVFGSTSTEVQSIVLDGVLKTNQGSPKFIEPGAMTVSGKYSFSAEAATSLNTASLTVDSEGSATFGNNINLNLLNNSTLTVSGELVLQGNLKVGERNSSVERVTGNGSLTANNFVLFGQGNQTVSIKNLIVNNIFQVDSLGISANIQGSKMQLAHGIEFALWGGTTALALDGTSVNLGDNIIREAVGSGAKVTFSNTNTFDISGLSDNFIASMEIDESITADGFYATSYYQIVGKSIETTISDGAQFKVIKGGVTYESVKSDSTGGGLVLGINDVYCLVTKDEYSTTAVKDTEGVTAGATKLYVGRDKTLTIDDRSFALPSIFGEGNVVLATNATLTNTDLSHVTGKLTINSGVTLTLGTDERQTVAIDSFSSIDLAGSIKAQNKSERLKNLSVGSGADGAVFSKDMGSSDDDCLMTFAGTTEVDGTLRIGNHWNAQFKIDKLTGNGSLLILSRDVNDKTWGASSKEAASYTLSDVSNFGGSVTVNNSEATVNVTLGTENANVAANFTKTNGTLNLTVDATTTLSGTVSGAAITINEGKALDITGKVTVSGSVANSGSLTVSSGGTLTGDVSGSLTVSSGGIFIGDVSGGTFTLNGVWDLTEKDAHTSGNLAAFLAKVSEGSGTVQLDVKSSKTYLLGRSVDSKGLDLSFIGSYETVINGWDNTKAVLSISKESTLSTEGALRVESTATVQVQDGGAVKVGGKLNLGHTEGSNYGHFSLEGGQLIAQGVGRTNPSDAVDSNSNTFTMSGGILTLTQGGDKAFSDVYTVISRGTLDTSQAAWGIKGNGDGSVRVGGVTVSDAYTTKEGTTNNSGYALTLTGANITGNITLEGTAGLILKNVTVTGENVTVGGDNRTISVAEGSLTVEKSVTTKGLLQVQENATLKLNNADTTVTTITNRDGSTESAAITGGSVSMTYDTADNKGVISGATISNAAIDVSQRSVLALSNSTLDSGVITLNSNAVLELAASVNGTLTGSIVSAENATRTTLRVSGSAVETLSGTVDVSVTDIQSGTLTFNGSSASLGALIVGAGAVLNAAGSSQTLNLSAVVENQGTLNLNGVSALTFTLADVFDNSTYVDEVIGEGAKNGFINRFLLIRNSGSGAIENLSVGNVTVNGMSMTASSEETGLYAAVKAEGAGSDQNSVYVVNEGNLVYNDATSNSSGNDTVKQLWLTGGTLVLDQSDIKSGVGVHVKQDSTVNIGTDRTLTDSQVASVENGATLTLTGSGTYSISAGEAEITSMTSGVAVGTGESGFTGTVLLNYGVMLAEADLNAFANGSSSSVKMNGVSGTLKSGDISTNLVLEDYTYQEKNEEGESQYVTVKALTIEGAGSITFNGAISGTGEMMIAPSDAAAENTLIFSGDVSGWTGKLEVAAGKANVTFTGEAKEINAYVADTFSDSVLNMVVDASEGRSFTQGISADTLRLTNGTEGNVVDVSSGSYIVSTKTDLTESNVILQVKGTGSEDSNLYSSLTELASDGSSGINISDSEKTLTTIRTNTQDASIPENATLSYCTFIYNNSTAKISGSTIDRAVIDVRNGSTLELSGVVLTNSCWVHDDDASTPAPTGNLVLDGVELQMAKGTASTEDGSGVALTLTGGTTAATNADGSEKTLTGKVYVMDLTRISDFATISGSGNGLTLNFDTYGKGFAELYETLKGYDYVAVKFSDDVVSVDFKTLKVTSKITNGQNDVATSQGYYYNNNGASGVVVYFDAIALPEPTTSTLGLLALAALCARRRRSRTRAHAEHA